MTEEKRTPVQNNISNTGPPAGEAAPAGGDSKNVVILPPEAVREAAAQGRPLEVTIQAIAHSGPLPPPAVLRGYDEVIPGLSRTIVQEFQNEARHRRRLQTIGQTGAISIAVGSIICGTFLGYVLNSWPAALAIIGPVCGIVGTAQLLEFWFKMK
jgi:uncharacterized membrane protein